MTMVITLNALPVTGDRILGKVGTSAGGYTISYNVASGVIKPIITLRDSADASILNTISVNTPINVGERRILTWVVDNTNKTVSIFENGIKIDTKTWTGAFGDWLTETNGLLRFRES